MGDEPHGDPATEQADGTASNGGGDGRPRRAPARRVEHLSMDERAAAGKAARAEVGRGVHGEWEPAADRPDPVDLLEEQGEHARAGARADPLRADAGVAVHVLPRRRVPDGVRPRRRAAHGLDVQLCGDAHLSNFGVFAAPDRRLVFSVNDFDETLPGPVRVGPQAARGELRGRRPRPRLRREDQRARSTSPPPARTARRCAPSPGCGRWTSGTRASTSTTSLQRWSGQATREAAQAVREEPGEGAGQGQHAGARQAHRGGRRRAADRQRPAADRPDRGRWPRARRPSSSTSSSTA